MTAAKYQTAVDAFDDWRENVLTGTPPALYPIGPSELSRIEVGPGLVTLFGGAPGAGKTAATMQFVVDALRLTPTLRAVVCNVEMPPGILLDRQLARLSGVDLTAIRYRQLGADHAERIDAGLHTLESFADRLAFVRPPFDLSNVAATADAFDAGLILLDYIQRIAPPGKHDAHRSSVNETMDYIRQFADAGTAVIVVAAVGRTKDAKGRSSYAGDGLSLASFRESSELEYGADDAFILTPDDDDAGRVTLRHLKSRHGECRDIGLQFDKSLQRFEPYTAKPTKLGAQKKAGTFARKRVARSALAALWNRTDAAADDDEGDA
ncbi:MAG: AAA family ATPase [Phycisphaerales bacterium]|nr:AAA family ATPase [Phycisphaerales bacterium]MCB9858604.1 AAA family ATPase [Phycisphaerales bacterium]